MSRTIQQYKAFCCLFFCVEAKTSVDCSFLWVSTFLLRVLLYGSENFCCLFFCVGAKFFLRTAVYPIFSHHIRFLYWHAIFYLRSCVAAFKPVTSSSILMASFLVSDVTKLYNIFIFAAYNILPSPSLGSQVKYTFVTYIIIIIIIIIIINNVSIISSLWDCKCDAGMNYRWWVLSFTKHALKFWTLIFV